MTARHQHTPARGRADTGYAKSVDTRNAILRAAIAAFGRAGFAAASTRQIAAAAGVNQPAINYHFGSKEALYKACAEEILGRFTGPLGDLARRSMTAVRAGMSRQDAASQLRALLAALADVMIRSERVSEAAGFVEREMREPGLAYHYLYQQLWAPGIKLAARLIANVKGRARTLAEDRVDAIMMISGIAAFGPGLSVSMQVMGWQQAGAAGKALVLERLAAQIDAWQRLRTAG